MPRIVPPSQNGAQAYLIQLFRETEQKLIKEILRKRGQGYVDYAEVAALERVRKDLQRMVNKAGKYVPLAIEHEFYEGKEARAGYANAKAAATAGRTKAVETLTDNLLGQVEEMAAVAYQDTANKLFLVGRVESDLFRQIGLTKAAESLVLGKGPMTTTEQLMAELQAQGITAFVDALGRKWGLQAYGDMAVRTTVRQAQVAAVLTEDDQDLYKIINGSVPCRLCAIYGGRVYSKSGTNPHYPPLSDAFGKIDPAGANSLENTFLNIHPNCLCTLVPFNELGKTDKQLEAIRRQSNPATNPYKGDPRTKKQKAQYEEKERNRARYRESVKQFNKYRDAGIPGLPTNYSTFAKHKALNDDKYKEWLRKFRESQRNKQ